MVSWGFALGWGQTSFRFTSIITSRRIGEGARLSLFLTLLFLPGEVPEEDLSRKGTSHPERNGWPLGW